LRFPYNNVIISLLNNAFVIESGVQPLSIFIFKGIPLRHEVVSLPLKRGRLGFLVQERKKKLLRLTSSILVRLW
jgi:hypothetical protein